MPDHSENKQQALYTEGGKGEKQPRRKRRSLRN